MPRKVKAKPVDTPTTEVRFLYGGNYRVEVLKEFKTHEEAMTFAKKLGLPIKETADAWD